MYKIGHRGAPRVTPANTMGSFKAALENGCDWVESDSRPAADGFVVLAHDDVIKDRFDNIFRISITPSSTLSKLDLGNGEGVPTLEELIDWAIGRIGVMNDVKVEGCEEQIGAQMMRLPTDQRWILGAKALNIKRFRELFPALFLSQTFGHGEEERFIQSLPHLNTEAVTLAYPLITPNRVNELHQRNIKVIAWTVNDLTTAKSLVEMGVDGIISDDQKILAGIEEHSL
ncbi:MAG: glycerophosphodiester phosphodiesterase [bacterium]